MKLDLDYLATLAETTEFQPASLEEVVRLGSLWQPRGLAAPSVRVVAEEELWAGKLCALLARSAPRDLWDAARLPQQAPKVWGSKRFHRFAACFVRPIGPRRRSFVRRLGVSLARWLNLTTRNVSTPICCSMAHCGRSCSFRTMKKWLHASHSTQLFVGRPRTRAPMQVAVRVHK